MTSQEIDARIAKAMSLDELDRLALVAESGAQHAEICRRAYEIQHGFGSCWCSACMQRDSEWRVAS